MRTYPVNQIDCQMSHAKKFSVKAVKNNPTAKISFRGREAAAKGLVGTLAGIGLGTLLTIGSGGLLAPLLLSMGGCAAGCIKGSADETKKEKDDDDHHDVPAEPWG